MDVSLSGAFINAAIALPEATRITLTHSPGAGLADIVFNAVTRRSVDPSRRISVVPGFAVLWENAATTGSPDYLRRTLTAMLQTDVRVRASHDGGAVWIAAGHPPARSDPARAALVGIDLERLNGMRPHLSPPGGICLAPGFQDGVEIVCYVNREPFHGRVADIKARSFVVRSGSNMPRVGDAVTCHYQGSEPTARLVGVVSGILAGSERGFQVELVRVDTGA